MDQNEQDLTNNKEPLSQPYLQNVERMKQQIGEIVSFELPKEILIEREHAWDKLFEKYSEIIPNDAEINIQDSNWESKNNGSDANGKDDDEGENKYFSKCRTPLRKHPALVQYWVDTGNPPYQLVDEISSGTGSSLSETENSKSISLIDKKRSDLKHNRDNTASLYSSVDTAAYILSNTNVTKKSDTIAIVEGAKNSNIVSEYRVNSIPENRLSKNSSKDYVLSNKTLDNSDNNSKFENKSNTNKTIGLADHDRSSLLLNETIANDKNENIAKDSPVEPIKDHRMKITDILPTLAHLDKLLNSTHINDEPHDKIQSDENTLFEKTPSAKPEKLFNRKKLYTERNSPIDIIVSLNNKRKVSVNGNSHPALYTPITKATTLFSRRRTRRFHQRSIRRFSRLSDTLKNSRTKLSNIKNTEMTMNNGNEDVLKSSRLTQSKKKARRCLRRTSVLNKKSTMENTRKKRRSSLTSYNSSDVSHNLTESFECDTEEFQREKKLADLVALCSLKHLEILLERYVETKSSLNNNLIDISTNKMLTESSVSSKKDSDDVHEVDLDSQESNQSTILICKCTNDREINTTLKTKNRNELQQNINGKMEKIDSTTICSALLIESDENSSTESRLKSQTRVANSIIEFSSDDDDDFIKIIRKNVKKYQKNSDIFMSKSDKSVNNIAKDCENLIKDLTDQCNEDSEIPIEFPTAPNLIIVESDDEDSIDTQKFTTKAKKKNGEGKIARMINKSSTRTGQTLESSSVTNINRNSTKITVAKVLRYQSSSDSSAINENLVTPPKRLKLDDNIASKASINNSIEQSRRTSTESSDKDSNVHDTIGLLNGNVSQWSERKRKTRVHFVTETNVPSTDNTTNKIPATSPLSMKEFNTVSKTSSTSLEKWESPSRLTPSCPSSTNEKINEEIKITNRNDDISIDRNKRKKMHRRDSPELKRTTVKNESLPRINNTPRRTKTIDRLSWNESSSDDDELIVGSRNEKKISPDKINKNSVHERERRTIISNLLDDSSSDESLKYQSFDRSERINMKNDITKKTMTFRTRFDDSDSDE